jgi:hypothetical protein
MACSDHALYNSCALDERPSMACLDSIQIERQAQMPELDVSKLDKD